MTRSLKLTSYVVVPLLVALLALQWADAKKPPKDPPPEPPQSPVRYRILYLNPLEGMDWATCTDMNDVGEIVGCCGSPAERRYFLFTPNADFTDGEMIDIASIIPSDAFGVEHVLERVCDINNSGQIAGQARLYIRGDDGEVISTFVMSFRLSPTDEEEEAWEIETAEGEASMMNEQGDIVGRWWTNEGTEEDPLNVIHTHIWAAGSAAFVDLGALNDGVGALGNLISDRDASDFVTIAGEVHNQERETFVYQYRIGGDPSSQIDLQKYIMPGIGDSTETNARAMNGQGQIASEAYVSKRGKRTIWHAVVYCPTTEIVTDLGTLGGEDSIARAINDIGDVVGMSDIQSNQVSSTFLLTEGVMWDLAELIDRDENGELPYGMFGGHYLVYDHPTINNLRFICGPGGDYDDENRAYLLVPYVPQ